MSVEYLPVGIACNISCGYCYQDPMRDAGNINVPRNWPKVQEQLERLGQDFSVFGGEPLLTSMEHLEEIFAFGLKRFGKNGIQTNGSLITDAHIDLFQRYRVQVGISIDGPGDLNSIRCTKELTRKTEKAISKLCMLSLTPSIICTIHKGNNDLDRLLGWFDGLENMGVRHLNIHELEVECGRDQLALSEEDNAKTFLEIYEWSKNSKMNIIPFADIRLLLTEEYPNVMCTWNHCDPITTTAVQGISASGDMSNCGRTNKDGVNWIKADKPGFERYISLYNTPQEHGGCQGCRYFAFCNGHCPGTAIDGDWRNRTSNCQLWYKLFSMIEQDLIVHGYPIITEEQKNEKIRNFITPKDQQHGDAHGDSPHGDAHGDHTDTHRIAATILDRSPL